MKKILAILAAALVMIGGAACFLVLRYQPALTLASASKVLESDGTFTASLKKGTPGEEQTEVMTAAGEKEGSFLHAVTEGEYEFDVYDDLEEQVQYLKLYSLINMVTGKLNSTTINDLMDWFTQDTYITMDQLDRLMTIFKVDSSSFTDDSPLSLFSLDFSGMSLGSETSLEGYDKQKFYEVSGTGVPAGTLYIAATEVTGEEAAFLAVLKGDTDYEISVTYTKEDTVSVTLPKTLVSDDVITSIEKLMSLVS